MRPSNCRLMLITVTSAALVLSAACSQQPPAKAAAGQPKAPKAAAQPAPAPPAPVQDLGDGVTTTALSQAIVDHVNAGAAATGGRLQVPDAVGGQTLSLVLDKVHDDRLTGVGGGTYFACSDFKDPNGKTWDVDFWVKGSPDGLQVTQTLVHKEDGVARYGWVEENGVWRTDPPQSEPAVVVEPEHPEHPEGEEHPEHPEGDD